jgi:branched-chain amino acid transport system ATP-binding protein
LDLLQVENIAKNFGGVTALEGVSFSIAPGEIVGLIGPNGAGKTTLFNVITGFAKPTRGRVVYEGQVVSHLPPYQVASRGLIRTYQKTSIFPSLTVSENVSIGRHRQSQPGLWAALFHTKSHSAERAQTKARVQEVLEFLEISRVAGFLSQNLSYGDQRKLEIAIALSSRPKFLLLDEPAAGLNPEETAGMMRMIKKIKEQGITILVVEHDMKLVMGVCEKIVVLNYGVKIAEGTPAEIQNHQEVIKVYLGEEVEESA